MRSFLPGVKAMGKALLLASILLGGSGSSQRLVAAAARASTDRPNILFCISDDQSWPHVGAAGDAVVKTPAFDRIARSGVLLTHAFVDAPSCTPSRSAILTGQHMWRLEEAGNLHSTLRAKFQVYPEILEKAGYVVGHSGKGWAPGRAEPGGRARNPAGPRFRDFQTFLSQIPGESPFCYWLGSHYPHRPYPPGSGLRAGKSTEQVQVPPHLPDEPIVRGDLLDYYVAIEKFDHTVLQALESLQKVGLLENTLIVITSDNGMPFPRGKATLYDSGVRVPLAVSWPGHIEEGRRIDALTMLTDLAPTFLEAAGLEPPTDMTGRSLLPLLLSKSPSPPDPREAVFFGMERHSGARFGGKGYPSRAIRTRSYLYSKNFQPDRWPGGDPDPRGSVRAIPYGEVDPSPSKTLLRELQHQQPFRRYFDLAFAKRPAQELYDLTGDPAQLSNLAGKPDYAKIKQRLSRQLMDYLTATADPRALGKPALWDYYPHYGNISNPAWKVAHRR